MFTVGLAGVRFRHNSFGTDLSHTTSFCALTHLLHLSTTQHGGGASEVSVFWRLGFGGGASEISVFGRVGPQGGGTSEISVTGFPSVAENYPEK